MLLDAVIGHKANVHPAGHLLGAVIPAPVWRRRDRADTAAPCLLASATFSRSMRSRSDSAAPVMQGIVAGGA
jgi:hypothetical protein